MHRSKMIITSNGSGDAQKMLVVFYINFLNYSIPFLKNN